MSEETTEELTTNTTEEKTEESGVDNQNNDDFTPDKDGKDSSADDADDGASSYADAIELPEGMELDKSLLEKAEPILKEAGLNNEQVNELAKVIAERELANAQAQQEYIEQQLNEWAEQAKTDKEFGGDKFEENLGTIKEFMSKYATDEFKSVLEDTGLGNHPEMIRFMYRVAKLTKEDQPVGGDPSPERVDKQQARLNLYKT